MTYLSFDAKMKIEKYYPKQTSAKINLFIFQIQNIGRKLVTRLLQDAQCEKQFLSYLWEFLCCVIVSTWGNVYEIN